MLNQDIFHIISNVLHGKAPAEEKALLEQWMNEMDENKQVFLEIERVWKLTGVVSGNIKVDTDKEWQRFKELRQNPQESNHDFSTTLKLSPWTLKIAAIVLPLIILASLLFYFIPSTLSERWITLETFQSTRKIQLEDGTKVWVNKNSKFMYPEKFKGTERLVKLSGEAFFEVSKNGNPFKVETEKVLVKVLGTKFNIRCLKTDKLADVIVEEGKVMFTSKRNPTVNTILTRGERGVLNDASNTISKENISPPQFLSWINQSLIFENTPMKQVGVTLERYFNKKIIVPDALKNCLITGTFQHPELKETLDIICTMVGFSYSEKADTLIFSGKGCNK